MRNVAYKAQILCTFQCDVHVSMCSYSNVTYIFKLVAIFVLFLMFMSRATVPFVMEFSEFIHGCIFGACRYVFLLHCGL